MWSEILDGKELEKALELTKGIYQRNILNGYESLSGSTIRGRAGKWSASYKRSRDSLLEKMKKASIKFSVETRAHGKRVLIIGEICGV